MKALTELIVRLFDLIEAEGRAAKMAIFRLAGAILVLVVAALLFIAAAGFFMAALFVLLAEALGVGGAMAIVGLLLLIASFIFLQLASALRDGGRPGR